MDVYLDVTYWLSADQIASLAMPGYPTSGRRVHDRATKEGWESRLVHSAGKTGSKREYKIPERLLPLIEQHQRGELPPPPEKPVPVRQAQLQAGPVHYRVSEGSPQPEGQAGIDTALLRLCLGALAYIYGESFAREPAALQLDYAADFYNQLARLAAAHPGGLKSGLAAFTRLETRGLADQLRLLVQMASVRPYLAGTIDKQQ